MEYLNEYMVLIVIGICLCVGYVLKHLVPGDKINRWIPFLMAVIGVGVNMWMNAFAITPEILLSGMVSGLASTGMHQVFKQFISKGGENNGN